MSAAAIPRAVRESTLLRSLSIVIIGALLVLLLTAGLSAYRDLQLAYGGYYFAVLAGLTVLAGISGKISLGQGALMAVGAYTTALLIGNEGWALAPALAASAAVAGIVGIPLGLAASRLRGPYLAGVTLAFAVGLPALADKFPGTFGGENGLFINPPTHPSWLGSNFAPEHWEAWVSCAAALIVLFALYNLVHSGVGRSWRAVRDDEIAASLCGLHVGRNQTVAFVVSAACAGLGGGAFTAVFQLAAPGSFQLQLSLYLLAGVVVGGLGSLVGAIWGAALLVFLPNWSTDLANAFSLPTNVSHNLPLAIYGVVLIAAMLLWPTGIQGGVRAVGAWLRHQGRRRSRRPGAPADRPSAAS